MIGKGEYQGATDDETRHDDERDAADGQAKDFAEPTEHEVFEILANERRRYALRTLFEADAGTSLGALADRVAACENDTTVDEVSTDQRKRVYTALQQSHLPKMERTGVVRFDQDTARVVPTRYLGRLRNYLDAGERGAREWNRYYLGLSLAAGGVVTAVAAGVAPFTALPTLGWFALSVVALGACAVAHTYQTRRRRTAGTPDET